MTISGKLSKPVSNVNFNYQEFCTLEREREEKNLMRREKLINANISFDRKL